MSKAIARINDATFGYCSVCKKYTAGKISVVNAKNSFCENKLIAATGDTALCLACDSATGTIADTGSTVIIEGKKMARTNDDYSGAYSGTIRSGASKSYEGGA